MNETPDNPNDQPAVEAPSTDGGAFNQDDGTVFGGDSDTVFNPLSEQALRAAA